MKPPGRPERVEILDLQGGLIDEVPFSPRSTDEFTFDWENFEPPKGLFYLRVVGVDDDSNVFYRASPTALSAVLPGLFHFTTLLMRMLICKSKTTTFNEINFLN